MWIYKINQQGSNADVKSFKEREWGIGQRENINIL
jgi:hypothetical protein